MGNNNSFFSNASSFFDKIMKQNYISKSEILQLKKQFKQLKNQDERYNNLFNRITRIGNTAKGKNTPTILAKVYEDFKEEA